MLFAPPHVFSAFALHLLASSAKSLGTYPSSFFTVCNACIPKWCFLVDLAVLIKVQLFYSYSLQR